LQSTIDYLDNPEMIVVYNSERFDSGVFGPSKIKKELEVRSTVFTPSKGPVWEFN